MLDMYKFVFVITALIINCGIIFSQDNVVVDTLQTSTISATKRISTTKHSTPIQVLTKTNIEKLGVQELYEALKTFSGVNIKDYGGIGGQIGRASCRERV